MLVPPSPCVRELFSPSPSTMYMHSPAQPCATAWGGLADLDGPVGSWDDNQVSRWLLEVLLDQGVPHSEAQAARSALGGLDGAALLTLTQQDLERRVHSAHLARIIYHQLALRATKARVHPDEAVVPGLPCLAEVFMAPDASPQPSDSCSAESTLPALLAPILSELPLLDELLLLADQTAPVYHEMEAAARPASQGQGSQEVPLWAGPESRPETTPTVPHSSPIASLQGAGVGPDDMVYRLGGNPVADSGQDHGALHFAAPPADAPPSPRSRLELVVTESPASASAFAPEVISPTTDDDVLFEALMKISDSVASGQVAGPPAPPPPPPPPPPAGDPKPRRPGGRPKSLLPPAARRRSTGRGERGGVARPAKGRLWQFLARLLNSREHNPALIRWEDRDEGVFVFVQGQRVAELWGRAKANGSMTYEKMSRTMRTYKNRAFEAHPRRLHYKFGEKAKWRDLIAQGPLPVGA